MQPLQRGDLIQYFEVTAVDGRRFAYASVWQHKTLVLVVLPAVDCAMTADCTSELSAGLAQFAAQNTACVVTREPIAGVPQPGVLVADKWGEIVYVAAAADVAALASPAELSEWIDYVERRCPECEGEAR